MNRHQCHETDIAIVGGGAAGIAAATRLRSFDQSSRIMLFERDDALGGILRQCIHTGFGVEYFGTEMTGPEYAAKALARFPADRLDVRLDTHVTALHSDRRLSAVGPEGTFDVRFRDVILATGSREIPFGSLGIPSARPSGIFGAGEAQYLINRLGIMPGRRAVILGAGDIGLIMCRRFLFEGLEIAAVVEAGSKPSGAIRNIQTCVRDFGVPLLTASTVIAVHGNRRVEAVTVASVDDARRPVPGTFRRIECDTLLVAVGLVPEVDLALDLGISREGRGLACSGEGKTALPWLWVCGNSARIHPIVDAVSQEAESVAEALGGRPDPHKAKSGQSMPGWGASDDLIVAKPSRSGHPSTPNGIAGDPPSDTNRSPVCLVCPRSCVLHSADEADQPGRRLCPRGKAFLEQEEREPLRWYFSTYRDEAGHIQPYRLMDQIPWAKIRTFIEFLRKATPSERNIVHSRARLDFATETDYHCKISI